LELRTVLWDQPSATDCAIDEARLDSGQRRRGMADTTIKIDLDRLLQKGSLAGHPCGDGRDTYRDTAVVFQPEVRDHPALLARLVRVLRLTPAECTHRCAAHVPLSPQETAVLHPL
jgi:hypothetical protein